MTSSSYKLVSLLCLSLLLNLGHANPNHNTTRMNHEDLESILIDSKQDLEFAKILNNNDIKIASNESKTSEKQEPYNKSKHNDESKLPQNKREKKTKEKEKK